MHAKKISLTDNEFNIYEHFEKLNYQYQYLKRSIDYYLAYHGTEYIDQTIIVIDKHNPILLCPIFRSQNQISFFNEGITVFENHLKKNDVTVAYKVLKNELVSQNAERILFKSNSRLNNVLWTNDSQIITKFSGKIDLTLSEESILAGVRKSYRSLINQGRKNGETILYNHQNITPEILHQFKDFHIFTSGKQTRSDLTWDLQFEMIKNNEAFLVLTYLENKIISGILTLYGTQDAYYGVAVNDRTLMKQKIAISYWPMLKSIFYAKEIGLKYFNMGTLHQIDFNPKEAQIGSFKRGFSLEINPEIEFIRPQNSTESTNE